MRQHLVTVSRYLARAWARRPGVSRVRTRLRRLFVLLASVPVALLPLACGPASDGTLLNPYLPRNAHQAYGHSLAQARLAQTSLGRDWLDAAERALEDPERVELPLNRVESLDRARPGALGYRFGVEAGQRIEVEIEIAADEPLDAFVDLFEMTPIPIHVASTPAPSRSTEPSRRLRLEWAAAEETELLLRVQPELLRGGEFRVSIAAQPYLSFPVDGMDIRAIQSGFGAERDGGRRAHRGVDIFADRGTPALAALDAWVTRVETTPRGGNVIWLQPLFGDMRLYYAHLDSQRVSRAQFVLAGDVLGTVGNTGNARTTPPHLHFGVYLRRRGMRGGARDPYDFLR